MSAVYSREQDILCAYSWLDGSASCVRNEGGICVIDDFQNSPEAIAVNKKFIKVLGIDEPEDDAVEIINGPAELFDLNRDIGVVADAHWRKADIIFQGMIAAILEETMGAVLRPGMRRLGKRVAEDNGFDCRCGGRQRSGRRCGGAWRSCGFATLAAKHIACQTSAGDNDHHQRQDNQDTSSLAIAWARRWRRGGC